MDQMEDKLGAILNNPQLMQQIMSMAQSLGGGQSAREEQTPAPAAATPAIDPGMLQKFASLAQTGSIDANQKALLAALNPYLSQRKVLKLEKAMRSAKLARAASGFLGQGGLSLLMGR